MDHKKAVEKIVKDLVKRLEIEGKVKVDIDETGAFRVHIETDDTGLVIGYHGQTLESLQIILGLLVSRKIGEWQKVYVNVGDYREKREEALMYVAQKAAERAITSGKPVELARLPASERRIVHLTLSGDERVETESVGEGKDRILVVKPKRVDSSLSNKS